MLTKKFNKWYFYIKIISHGNVSHSICILNKSIEYYHWNLYIIFKFDINSWLLFQYGIYSFFFGCNQNIRQWLLNIWINTFNYANYIIIIRKQLCVGKVISVLVYDWAYFFHFLRAHKILVPPLNTLYSVNRFSIEFACLTYLYILYRWSPAVTKSRRRYRCRSKVDLKF